MSENPYEPPADQPLPTLAAPTARITPAHALTSFLIWAVVCSISAVPSFMLGLVVSENRFAVAAMSLGILAFAVGYTVFDLIYFRERIRRNPALRRTVLTGYSTRIVASVIFPVGVMVDMWFGMISIGIVRSVENTSFASGPATESAPTALTGFFSILIATLLQGCFLNVLLFGYMAAVYCIFVLFGAPTTRTTTAVPPPAVQTSDEQHKVVGHKTFIRRST